MLNTIVTAAVQLQVPLTALLFSTWQPDFLTSLVYMYKGNLEKQALTGDSNKFVQIF